MQRVQWIGRLPRGGTRRTPVWMSHANHSAAKALRLRLLEPLLHLGIALTGVGTVLLGCILPRLSAQWHLRDKDAGLLLLVQFATAASGALLVRRNLWKTLAFGYGLFGAGAISIFLLQQKSLPAFGVYGLGLGLAMTSNNMLAGRRHPKRMGAALAFLNFSWSAGSVACPLLAAQFLRHAAGGTAFGLVGLLALPFVLLPLLADRGDLDASTDSASTPSRDQRGNNHPLFCAARLSLCRDRGIRRELDEHLCHAHHCLDLRRRHPGGRRFLGGPIVGPRRDTSHVGLGAGTSSLSSVCGCHHSRRLIAAGGAQPAHHPRRIGSHRALPWRPYSRSSWRCSWRRSAGRAMRAGCLPSPDSEEPCSRG